MSSPGFFYHPQGRGGNLLRVVPFFLYTVELKGKEARGMAALKLEENYAAASSLRSATSSSILGRRTRGKEELLVV